MKNFNKKSSFKHFNTFQANERWSWSAISEDKKVVVITLWKDQIKFDDNRKPVWNTFDLPETQKNDLWKQKKGNMERIKHLKYSFENLGGLFRVIITVAKDIHSFPREIKNCYPWEGIWMRLIELNEETGECRAIFHSKKKRDGWIYQFQQDLVIIFTYHKLTVF